MTQVTTYYGDQGEYYDDAQAVPAAPLPAFADATYIKRSKWICLPFLIPIFLCGLSYAGDGQPFLTDMGFITLTILCLAGIVRELMVFPFRFGIGGMILFGGTLIWFCYDYMNHWLGISFTAAEIEPWVVAKAAFYHMIFVFFMILGLQINKGKWLEKLLQIVPEPSSKSLWFIVVILTFLIGMIPFFFFAEDPFYIAIWKSFWGGRGGEGASFTAGRTGNLNYSWGGYLTQVADIGMLGAVLAAFYAIVVSTQMWQKIICWCIWFLWIGVAFGTGTRGFTVFLSLPVIMLVFLKYSHKASMLMRRLSVRAYVMAGIVAVGILLLVQVQGAFRNMGFTAEQFTTVEVTDLTGNEMFSTTMLGMKVFPEEKPFFYSRVPLEGLIRALPHELYYLMIGPIPRALWNSKPVDPVYIWYNNTTTGKETGAEGTTISNGAVGHPYIRFGPFGVIEFGLLYGWAMGVVERSLRRSMNRPMALLFHLAFATFVFRAFRDLWWHNLYPIIIAGVVIKVLVFFANTLFGGGSNPEPKAAS